jgi:hypothetical protein
VSRRQEEGIPSVAFLGWWMADVVVSKLGMEWNQKELIDVIGLQGAESGILVLKI